MSQSSSSVLAEQRPLILATVMGISVAVAIKEIRERRRKRSPYPRPPCPPRKTWTQLLLGETVEVTRAVTKEGSLEYALMRWAPLLGGIYRLKILGAGGEIIILTDTQAVKELTGVKNLPKSPTYADLLPILGPHSLATTEGAIWKRQRVSYAPAFSMSFVRKLVPMFAEKTQRLIDLLMQETAASSPPRPLAMHELALLLTVEVICKVSFREDLNFLYETDRHPLYEAFSSLLNATKEANALSHLIGRLAYWWYGPSLRRYQWRLDTIIGDLIRDKLQPDASWDRRPPPRSPRAPPMDGGADSGGAVDEEKAGRLAMSLGSGVKDILSLSVKVAHQLGGKDLNREEILSQLKTFTFAGHDTTASLIAWALYYVSRGHPSVQDRLLAEVDAAFAATPAGSTPSEDLLPYLTCILKESLRLSPPASTARWAGEGTTVTTSRGLTYDIQESVIFIPVAVMHRDPKVWGEDADSFRPDRWEVKGFEPGLSFLPFLRGPRDCIGRNFALMEATTVLAHVYRHFTFAVPDGEPEERLQYSVTLRPMHGVRLIPVRRQQARA